MILILMWTSSVFEFFSALKDYGILVEICLRISVYGSFPLKQGEKHDV